MRILMATIHRNLVGGVEKYLQAVIPALMECGHELGLLHEDPSTPGRESIDEGLNVSRSWCVAEMGSRAALEAIAEWRPEVVYCHGLESPGSIAMETALQDAYPTVLFAHNYDRTCATGRKCHSFPGPRTCGRRMGPMCLVLHYPLGCGGLHPGRTWGRYRRHRLLSSRIPYFREVMVASTHMYRELQQHGADRERLHLVPYPTTGAIPRETEPASKSPAGHILFIGRLTDIKGCDYLIRAIPLAVERLGRPLTLTVAGEGPERRKLQEVAGGLGASVEFVGWVHTPEKLKLLRQTDLLAVPSLWPEPFGLVGIEAACMGVPAVGYASGGVLDWLIPGETGELAPGNPPTSKGLAEAIVRAFVSPDHYNTLCRGAWRGAQRFTMEQHIAKLEPILGGRPVPEDFRGLGVWEGPQDPV